MVFIHLFYPKGDRINSVGGSTFGETNRLRFDNGFGLTCRFRLFFAMVKIQGTPCMRSHISVHRATPKYFSNSFVFKTKIEKEGLARDSTPDLGAGVRRFKTLPRKLPHIPPTLRDLSFRQMSTSFSSSCNNRNLKHPFRRYGRRKRRQNRMKTISSKKKLTGYCRRTSILETTHQL